MKMEAWLVKAKGGTLLVSTCRRNEEASKQEASKILGERWSDLFMEGYRCVRVELKEIEE